MTSPNNSLVVNTSGVQALSNALAVALYQATSGTGSPSALATSGVASASIPPAPAHVNVAQQTQPNTSSSTDPSSTQPARRPNAALALPSIFRQRQRAASNKSKRPKVVQTWDRDIVCLPECLCIRGSIKYPRGKYRARLGNLGLIGKIHLTSDMTVEEVAGEVRSVFKKPMFERADFPFQYLQPMGTGSRCLTIPAVSSSFAWTAKQVARLGTSTGTIYILAKADLELDDEEESEESDDEGQNYKGIDDERPEPTTPNHSARVHVSVDGDHRTSPPGHSISHTYGSRQSDHRSEESASTHYEAYVDLIDLTNEPPSEGESSDLDDLPLTEVSLSSTYDKIQTTSSVDTIKVKHILLQHQVKVVRGEHEEDFQPIHIRRSSIFEDAVRAFSKPSFDSAKMFKVRFIGESAEDEGGPRREFFQRLMKAAFQSQAMFSGWPCHTIPVHNITSITNNHFFLVGVMIATSLIQGGQAPACFSPAIADYLVYNDVRSKPCIDDIPDADVREAMKEIDGATTTVELQSLVKLERFDFRFNCGYTKPATNIVIDDKDPFIKAIWLHYTYFLPHAELQQLQKGFRETLQMELLVCLHPDEIRALLVASSLYDVKASFFHDHFVVQYSEQGSNGRTAEEAVMLNWAEYINECASGNGPVKLGDILEFVSGASKIPPSGFPKNPSIKFCDDDRLPKASTCDVSITFPRKLGLLQFDQFKEMLDLSILGSCGFGNV